MNHSLEQIFGNYIQEKEKYQIFLTDGEILQIEIDRDANLVICTVKLTQVIDWRLRTELERDLKQALHLNRFAFLVKYRPDLFNEGYFEQIKSILKSRVSVINGYFDNAVATYENKILSIELKNGGETILEQVNVRKTISDLIYDEFSIRVEVVFTGKLSMTQEDVSNIMPELPPIDYTAPPPPAPVDFGAPPPQAASAPSVLISDISHQTKTPIANILLYASLLAEGELSPEQAAQAATLSRQAEKLSFLIQALVKASRLETGIITTAPEPQPVGPLLEGALAQARPQAEAKGLTLAAEPCGAAARFDRKWTAEALFNVVDNAVKYTPAGGRVTLSAVPLGQFCRVDVSDTGIGIPEEEQGRIFGRFYRGGAVRAEEGVGIGLYLVREILRRQGGYVKVASRPGQGTTFSLYLPRE